MKNPISNETKNRFRAVWYDGTEKTIETTSGEVDRLMAKFEPRVYDGELVRVCHDRQIDGAWVVYAELEY